MSMTYYFKLGEKANHHLADGKSFHTANLGLILGDKDTAYTWRTTNNKIYTVTEDKFLSAWQRTNNGVEYLCRQRGDIRI